MSNIDTQHTFNPNATGVNNGNFFGFPYSLEEATVVIYPVKWDVTTSYGGGASKGPDAILAASPQLDFYDWDYPLAWENRIGTAKACEAISVSNAPMRSLAEGVIAHLEEGGDIADVQDDIYTINLASRDMVEEVKKDTRELLNSGKKVILLGGDHSTPLGYMQALAENGEKFSILHIDAHADLRDAYEGFEYSHASIMFNALKIKQVDRLVQVAIRDTCPDEIELVESSNGRVKQFPYPIIASRTFDGQTWNDICRDIIESLGERVYVSFDIDGLDPSLCPGTGTPVAGGLSFYQATYLLLMLKKSGKKIIGADLNEVCPSSSENEWDANVGARLLYKLCSLIS